MKHQPPAGIAQTVPYTAAFFSARVAAKGITGCYSIINVIDVVARTKPVITISKSNDINCIIGTARLKATCGTAYKWQPVSTLKMLI